MEIETTEREVKRTLRVNTKGRLVKNVTEVYQRDDIGCSWPECSLCQNTNTYLNSSESKTIFIVDYEILNKYFDCIMNAKINNLIINQSATEILKTKSINTYKRLKNMVELEKWRGILVFPNKFCRETFQAKSLQESEEEHENSLLFKTFTYYMRHLKDIADVYLLTNNQALKNQYNYVVTIREFIDNFASNKEELEDFLGFDEQEDINSIMSNKEIAFGFKEHVQSGDMFNLINQGKALKGKIRYNRLNAEEATIFSPVLNRNIEIKGLEDLNRSINTDVVVIELLDPSEWTTVSYAKLTEEVQEVEKEEEEHSRPQIDQKFAEMKKLLDNSEIIPKGRVIGVLRRNLRNFAGEVSKVFGNNLCLVTLVDSRFPCVLLKSRNANKLLNKKIIVNIREWPQYSKYPLGNLIRIVGESGNNTVENDVILFEFNIETRDFSQRVLDCLPKDGENWRIPDKERSKRWDLRDEYICSVDPPGCKDIDDALHSKLLPNGNYEIGVHIADVTYFVKADSHIDLEAQNRCTTVYLVDRRTDMLPKLLTECLCSLVCHVERLAFSCIWEINPANAEIVNVRFGKSVIKSKEAYTYQQAQEKIDNPADNTELTLSLRRLLEIAKKLKAKRITKGALQLASTQVKFTVSEENNNPTDVSYYDLRETNSMVEEFMLLANVSVGSKILRDFPASAILRRHSSPKPEMIKQLAKILSKMGYPLDYSTSKTLANSLDTINRQNDPFFNKLVRILTTRTMHEATYFCSADFDENEFKHYGLAAEIYTHFTSPIRRYADVLVHRLLSACIDVESLPNSMCNKKNLTTISDRMNMRNRNARNASRASSEFFSFLFFKNKSLVEDGIVSGIQSNGFTVVIAKYGFEGFIDFDEKDVMENQRILKQGEKDDNLVKFNFKGKSYCLFDWVKARIEVQLINYRKQVLIELIN